jgi:hypothetical protein
MVWGERHIDVVNDSEVLGVNRWFLRHAKRLRQSPFLLNSQDVKFTMRSLKRPLSRVVLPAGFQFIVNGETKKYFTRQSI